MLPSPGIPVGVAVPVPPAGAAVGLAVPPSMGKIDEGKPKGLVVVAVVEGLVVVELGLVVVALGLVAAGAAAVELPPPPVISVQ